MNTNAAHQIPVHRQRRRISRQEMLRRKRAIRRRKRIARFFRISVAVLLLLTAVSFWQDYGGEILPTVNHLYYQLTARYDLPVSKYDFAALQEENETTFAESLSSVDADAENITEALSELVKNNAEAADFVADYPNRQNYLGQSIDLTHDVIIGQVPLFGLCVLRRQHHRSLRLWAYLPVHGLCILHPGFERHPKRNGFLL